MTPPTRIPAQIPPRMPARVLVGVVVLTLGAWGARAQPLTDAQVSRMGARLQSALDDRDWEGVVRIGERIMEARPELAVVAYNLACAHARLGAVDRALEWLDRSADNGFAGIVSVETDPDLEPLRADERFGAIAAKVRASRDERFEAFKAEAERAEIPTILPPGYDPRTPAPLVIVMHGSGGRGKPLGELHRDAAGAVGAIVAAPDALRPLGGGFNWTYRDEAEWMVFHVLDRISSEHRVDPRRVVLAGFSQGANIALEVGLKHPGRFVGLVPVCGHWEPDRMPIAEGAGGLRVSLIMGAEDPWAQTFEECQTALREAGVETRLSMERGVGHAYPPDAGRVLEEALRFVLGGGSP